MPEDARSRRFTATPAKAPSLSPALASVPSRRGSLEGAGRGLAPASGFTPHRESEVAAMLDLIESASRSLTHAGRSLDMRDDAMRRRAGELDMLTTQRDDALAELAIVKRALREARDRTVVAERLLREAAEARVSTEHRLAVATAQVRRLMGAVGTSLLVGRGRPEQADEAQANERRLASPRAATAA